MILSARSVSRKAVVASLLLWLVSLALPAIVFLRNPGTSEVQLATHYGFDIMLDSLIFGMFYGNFAFWANPVLLFGCIFLAQKRFRRAAIWLGIAMLLALQTFMLVGKTFVADEGGVDHEQMMHPTWGFYVWLAAIVIPFVVAVREHVAEKSRPAAGVPAAPSV